MTFAHPWVILLTPLPLLVRWLAPAKEQSSPAVRVPFLPRLEAANQQIQTIARKGRSLLLPGFVWLLLLAALAQPQWLDPPIERTIPMRDLLLLVDLSNSMAEEDFQNAQGKSVDRLTASCVGKGERADDRKALL